MRRTVGKAKTIHSYVCTVYIRYIQQANYHTYGHIRCTCTVIAKPEQQPLTWYIGNVRHTTNTLKLCRLCYNNCLSFELLWTGRANEVVSLVLYNNCRLLNFFGQTANEVVPLVLYNNCRLLICFGQTANEVVPLVLQQLPSFDLLWTDSQ